MAAGHRFWGHRSVVDDGCAEGEGGELGVEVLGELAGVDATLDRVDEVLAASGAVGVEKFGYFGVVFGGFDESWDAGREQRVIEYLDQVFDQLRNLVVDGCGVDLGMRLLVEDFEAVRDER